jgi:hypothetical protein
MRAKVAATSIDMNTPVEPPQISLDLKSAISVILVDPLCLTLYLRRGAISNRPELGK